MDRVFHVKQQGLNKFIVVAIDGPTGVGKSTLARKLADRWRFLYVDTGAMFRCLALKWKALEHPEEDEALQMLGDNTHIAFSVVGQVICDDQDVSTEIRTEEISKLASRISKFGVIREVMKRQQRQLVTETKKQQVYSGAVLEGRDIGTVVLPDATIKFFVDADPKIRAQRRTDQLLEQGQQVDYTEVLKALQERDQQDLNRAIAPLKQAEDAVLVDTTQLTPEQVLEQMSDQILHSAHSD
jgi:cytidylate kinase